jgi:hypothetical protein
MAACPRNNCPQDANHKQQNIEIVEALNELVQIRTGKDMLGQHWAMANDIKEMATGRDGGLYNLAKGAKCTLVDKKDAASLQLLPF